MGRELPTLHPPRVWYVRLGRVCGNEAGKGISQSTGPALLARRKCHVLAGPSNRKNAMK
ncbi:MAG: hypothetical protein ACK5E4_11980 [Planctomycetia bacterium]